MLPDHDRQLLTAYVDGELTGRQRRQVERLLRRSGEARELFRRLQGDSRTLRALPRVSATADLSVPVVQAIRVRRLKPRRAQRPASPPVFSVWSAAAAAAAVLFAVGLGSYLYYADPRPSGPEAGIVEDDPPAPGPKGDPADEGTELVEREAPRKKTEHVEVPPPKDPPKGPGAVAKGPKEGSAPVAPKVPKVLFAPGGKDPMASLRRVEPQLPAVLGFHTLDKPETRQQLRAELGGSSAFRVELPCRDDAQALARLQAALRARRLPVVVDATAARLRSKSAPKTDFAVYVENLTPAELVRLLQAASAEDKKASRRPIDRRFTGALVVVPMNPLDGKDLEGLLGVNPLRVDGTRGTGA